MRDCVAGLLVSVLSMMNCDSSHCDGAGLKPVRGIVTEQRSHFAFELLLCCCNEGIFFSGPNPREVVCACESYML